jgi:biopolymer transport protein ExbD
MKIERKTQTSREVSTASMPDIIFMLLIFFMVTTVMREFDGLDVLMPRAKMIEKLESKRHTAYIWATKDGLISVNDRLIGINALSGIMYEKMLSDPKITVSLKSDESATMKLITDIHTELRKANALKLSYSALTETN